MPIELQLTQYVEQPPKRGEGREGEKLHSIKINGLQLNVIDEKEEGVFKVLNIWKLIVQISDWRGNKMMAYERGKGCKVMTY